MNVKVSVLMPSYNHGRFIAAAIESVLGQTFQDFELIIVDDGSSDNSAEIISRFSSPKLRVEYLKKNVGACEAMNIALSMSRGSYIAVCNSDDSWVAHKLETQCSFLEQNHNICAVFSDVIWIGVDGERLSSRDSPYERVFEQKNRSRWAWLRDLIEGGNCLCHPSVLIRREVYETVGNYDNRLRQLPDLLMWTKAVQYGDIFVMPEKLVRFRLHETNTSALSETTASRAHNEHALIVRETINGITPFNFERAFGMKDSLISGGVRFEIEKALYLLEHVGPFTRILREIGLEAVYSLMKDSQARQVLLEKYGFDDFLLHEWSGKGSVWRIEASASVVDGTGLEQSLYAVRDIRSVMLTRVILRRLVLRAREALARRRAT
jgi:glycosyltransferase involved in cell wall biosynthesis